MHRHASTRPRVDASNTFEKEESNRNLGYAKLPKQWRSSWERISRSWRCGNGRRKQKDAKRICGTVHENDKSKGSHVQDEVERPMHHEEQELPSFWEGRHWDDNKGVWLDPGAVRQGKT